MKDYERVTQKQGEPKIVSKRVYYRLRELEDKIENGDLISTSDIGDNEIEFFVKHNADVRKETAKEILGEFYLWIGQDFDDIPEGGFIHIMKEDFKRRMNAFYKRYGVEVEE